MSECSGKLIAWMDGELPEEESREVERHLAACPECRGRVAAYKTLSGELDAYCDAALASSARRGMPRWAPAACAATAVAAGIALFVALPTTRVSPPAFHQPSQIAAAALPTPGPKELPAVASRLPKVHPRRAVATAQMLNGNRGLAQPQDASFLPNGPAIEIAFPADDMFPPGAVPEGMHFVADVTIAPDGSAERLRLRPRLAGFQRRTSEP